MRRWNETSLLKKAYIFFALIIGFALLYLFGVLYLEILRFEWNATETGDNSIRNLAIAFLGTTSGLAALFGVYLAILRAEENKRQSDSAESQSEAADRQSAAAEQQANTAEQGQITDQLNKATEGLGKNNANNEPVIEVRLGALYALERIAQDSIRDHIQIMEILCAYVRQNSPKKTYKDLPEKIDPLREDIQAALTIIGRRDKWHDGEKHLEHEQRQNYRVDLRNCDLHGAQLDDANLIGAMLDSSNLNDILLNHANLTDATLNHAILDGAQLNHANLTGAELSSIIWNAMHISEYNMGGDNRDNQIPFGERGITEINNANTQWAYITIGDISYLPSFTQKQLDDMFCGVGVLIREELDRPEHWPKPTDDADFMESYNKWRYPK